MRAARKTDSYFFKDKLVFQHPSGVEAPNTTFESVTSGTGTLQRRCHHGSWMTATNKSVASVYRGCGCGIRDRRSISGLRRQVGAPGFGSTWSALEAAASATNR